MVFWRWSKGWDAWEKGWVEPVGICGFSSGVANFGPFIINRRDPGAYDHHRY